MLLIPEKIPPLTTTRDYHKTQHEPDTVLLTDQYTADTLTFQKYQDILRTIGSGFLWSAALGLLFYIAEQNQAEEKRIVTEFVAAYIPALHHFLQNQDMQTLERLLEPLTVGLFFLTPMFGYFLERTLIELADPNRLGDELRSIKQIRKI